MLTGLSCNVAWIRVLGRVPREKPAAAAARNRAVLHERIGPTVGMKRRTKIDGRRAVGRDPPLTASIGTLWDHVLWMPKFIAMASLGTLPKVSDKARTAVLAAVERPRRRRWRPTPGWPAGDCPINCKAPHADRGGARIGIDAARSTRRYRPSPGPSAPARAVLGAGRKTWCWYCRCRLSRTPRDGLAFSMVPAPAIEAHRARIAADPQGARSIDDKGGTAAHGRRPTASQMPALTVVCAR